MSTSFWVFAISIILLRTVTLCRSECDVVVDDPWPTPFLLVPQGSSVRMTCRADRNSPTIFWSIDLAIDTSTVQYQFPNGATTLNNAGVYELPREKNATTLGLLINDTAKNNGTVIHCNRGLMSTLLVLESAQLKFEVLEQQERSINLTWSQESAPVVDTPQIFSLKINYGSNTHPRVIPINESYYYFTAPEGAPPCEVYNFSVTATYVGANYTGAGCSVPSPVISRTLPSLPDIDQVESSLSYLLTKQPNGGLILYVSLSPLTYCPTHVYTLIVSGLSNESEAHQQLFTPTESTMVASVTPDNLQDNTRLTFKVIVRNSLSETFYETSATMLYTTDVQNITVAVISGDDNGSVPGMVLVQCDFIPGSDAQGCMVVLVGESDNTTVNLTRTNTLFTACMFETIMITSLIEVFGYDIEFDGSVGTQQVPGTSVVTSLTDSYSALLCQPKEAAIKPFPYLSTQWIITIAAIGGAVLALSLLIIVSIVIIICRHSRKSSSYQPSQQPVAVNSYITNHEGMGEGDNKRQDIMPYYEQPQQIISSSLAHAMAIRDDHSENEYSRTSHVLQVSPTLSSGSESTTYSRLQDSQQEHAYHVLESTNRPPHGFKNEAFTSYPDGSQPSDPCMPIYHTIIEERPVEEQLYTQVPSSPSQTANNQSQEMGPIYQDVTELCVSTSAGTTPGPAPMSSTIVRITV